MAQREFSGVEINVEFTEAGTKSNLVSGENISTSLGKIMKFYNETENDFADIKGYIGYTSDDIYGIEADFENSTYTRLAGAICKTAGADFDSVNAFGGRKRCIITDSGVVLAYYGDTAYTETGALTQAVTVGGTEYAIGTLCQVMVEQPKFYYRVVPMSLRKATGKGYVIDKANYYVSDMPKVGFKVHPAFVKNGIETDFVYFSAFEASVYDVSANAYITDDAQTTDFTATSGDKLSSIAGAKPASGITQQLTRANARVIAANRGTGWSQAYAATVSATQLLFAVEYGSFNSQAAISKGVCGKAAGSGNKSVSTGATSLIGNASGMADGTDGLVSVSYRGEENLWGNIWTFVDGMNVYTDGTANRNNIYVADNGFSENTQSAPYELVEITASVVGGYVSRFAYCEKYDWLFIPAENNGNSALPVGDFYVQSSPTTGYKVSYLGGHWYSALYSGIFYLGINNIPSSNLAVIGTRIVYFKGV